MMLWWQRCQLNSTQDAIFHSLPTQFCGLNVYSLEKDECYMINATTAKHQLQSN